MDKIRLVKSVLVLAAVLIAAISLLVSHRLIQDLEEEEHTKMEVWAEAMRSFIAADENTDLNLVLKVINSNQTIPVIVLDGNGTLLDTRNIKTHTETPADSISWLKEKAREMKDEGKFMEMPLPHNELLVICYGDSLMLKRLAFYPIVQLGVVGLFIVIAVFALLASKRAEQNKVWVGLSRETAHQLGTPISSLMAWNEMLREVYPKDDLLPEMEKDIQRLQLIAERFSKIGSVPELKEENLCEIISQTAGYMRRRAPGKISISCAFPEREIKIRICAPLFQWVVENLCKNAMDAMPSGEGKIEIAVERRAGAVQILVSDTGKGMTKQQFKAVFRPGYTTKKRGWGLGLSLAKRIIEEYHRGKIFVKSSDPNVGTTFCIQLKEN